MHSKTAKKTEASLPPLLAETRRLMRRSGLHPRKALAQHYLVDQAVLASIVAAAEIFPEDIVLEVGPGLGFLTRELAARAGWVVAVEIDPNMVAILKDELASFGNVTILNQDIMKIDPAEVLANLPAGLPPSINRDRYKVVANLPYYVTSPVLRRFLEAREKPETMVVTIQKEVAKAIAAESGERSILSISVQFYGNPKIIRYVPATAFYPSPEVESAVLRIDLYSHPPVEVRSTDSFFTLVRAGFSAARKQIANSLAQGLGYDKSDILNMLDKAGIDPRRRAETLTIEEWARLWHEFFPSKKQR